MMKYTTLNLEGIPLSILLWRALKKKLQNFGHIEFCYGLSWYKPLIWINLALTVTLLPTTTYGVIFAIILSLFFSSELPLANISCCELEVQEEEESQGQAD